jgi:hypothetical protein
MTPQAMRSPALPAGSLFKSGLGMDHERRTTIGKNGIGSFPKGDLWILKGKVCSAIRLHSEIRHVARMGFRAFGIAYPVMCVRGIEVASRRCERGAFTFGCRVDVNRMFARRQVLQVKRFSHPYQPRAIRDFGCSDVSSSSIFHRHGKGACWLQEAQCRRTIAARARIPLVILMPP